MVLFNKISSEGKSIETADHDCLGFRMVVRTDSGHEKHSWDDGNVSDQDHGSDCTAI